MFCKMRSVTYKFNVNAKSASAGLTLTLLLVNTLIFNLNIVMIVFSYFPVAWFLYCFHKTVAFAALLAPRRGAPSLEHLRTGAAPIGRCLHMFTHTLLVVGHAAAEWTGKAGLTHTLGHRLSIFLDAVETVISCIC